jgi:CheY-like chemotaxis protein
VTSDHGAASLMPRILLVEDTDEVRVMLARRLARRFSVILAEDGYEAIQLAERELPDLVIMDLSLPELDGWEAIARLKAAKTTADIPVIALTAYPTLGEKERALQAGCDGFALKPVKFEALLDQISALLAARQYTH